MKRLEKGWLLAAAMGLLLTLSPGLALGADPKLSPKDFDLISRHDAKDKMAELDKKFDRLITEKGGQKPKSPPGSGPSKTDTLVGSDGVLYGRCPDGIYRPVPGAPREKPRPAPANPFGPTSPFQENCPLPGS